MLPVEIIPIQETLVLRARSSELLILPSHVRELKGLSDPKAFSQYFTNKALLNRPARKLFEAWLRKDPTVWKRLFTTVHEQMTFAPEAETAAPPAEEKPAKAQPKAEKADKAEKSEKSDKPEKAEKTAKTAKPKSSKK